MNTRSLTMNERGRSGIDGPGAVTFVTGPLWHPWISRLFLRSIRERGHAR